MNSGTPSASSPDPRPGQAATAPQEEIPDEVLDRYILTRLELAGVDLSVLPEDDGDAPADRRRILASARRFLRTTPGVIQGFVMDPQDVPPAMYPARTGLDGLRDGHGDRG